MEHLSIILVCDMSLLLSHNTLQITECHPFICVFFYLFCYLFVQKEGKIYSQEALPFILLKQIMDLILNYIIRSSQHLYLLYPHFQDQLSISLCPMSCLRHANHFWGIKETSSTYIFIVRINFMQSVCVTSCHEKPFKLTCEEPVFLKNRKLFPRNHSQHLNYALCLHNYIPSPLLP